MQIENVPVKEIKIGDFAIAVAQPFSEGHVCSAGDAHVLNQVVAENTRNNFNTRVKRQEELKAEGKEHVLYTKESLQAEINSFLAEYEFGVRSNSREPVDPIEAELRRLAKGIVEEALARKGFSVRKTPKEKIEELIAATIERFPDLRKEAKKNVEKKSRLGDEMLEQIAGLAA